MIFVQFADSLVIGLVERRIASPLETIQMAMRQEQTNRQTWTTAGAMRECDLSVT